MNLRTGASLRLFTVAVAACFSAAAAWLSLGTLGYASQDGPRLALLPVSPEALAAVAVAVVAVMALAFAGASLAPVALLGFALLPWLPVQVPAAFLIWVWPLTSGLWAAVLLLMAASVPCWPARLPMVRRPVLAASLAAGAVFGASAWRAAPMVPGGDEPHYLIITQSLLIDGDLTIEDVHRRRDYHAYYAGELAPHVQQHGRDGRMYSIHAPGLPALVAPAFAAAGYPGVVCFLIVVAAAGAGLAWHLAWSWTQRTDAAWFGWAAVTLPVTAIFHSFSVYPDGPGSVLTLTGLWALLRADAEARSGAESARPWWFHGAALAALPWFHSRFAVLAASLGALVLLRLSRTRNPAAKAVAFLSVPALSAILWAGYFVAIYGTPSPAAPYGPGNDSIRWIPGGLGGLLFDQRFGVVTYAPVVAVALAGLGLMVARRPPRRLGLEILFVMVPYLLTVTHFAMWWGGWSAPARFFAPVLPLLAVPAAAAWAVAQQRTGRVLAAAALILTALASAIVVGVDRGRLAFNTRDAPALWLDWLGRLADLPSAAPMWARDTDLPLFRAIAVWLAVAAGVWYVVRAIDRSSRFRDGAAFRAAAAAVLAIAVMAGASIVWAVGRSSGRTAVASQFQLLDAIASGRQVLAVQLNPLMPVNAANVPGRLLIEQLRRPGRRPADREAQAMFSFPALPAGQYRITFDAPTPRGWLMIGIARDWRDPFAIRTLQLPAGPLDFEFPLPVAALVIRGDEDAWRTVRGVTLEPLAVLPASDSVTTAPARRAVRYGAATVYFLDDRNFPEPEAFWSAGGRATTVAIQPDEPGRSPVLLLRNGAAGNRVILTSGAWQAEFDVQPGEERRYEVPIGVGRGAALLRIETSTGFRPAEHDPASRDHRFLGVWVKLEG